MNTKLPFSCRLCSQIIKSKNELAFEEKPLCNFFTSSKSYKLDLHELTIGQCCYCGLIQLTRYPPAISITPKHSWIRYNEPESHLSDVSDYINTILSDNKIKVLGLGPFEQQLIGLLNPLFIKKQVNILKYLSEVESSFPYLEAYQELATDKNLIKKIKNEFGTSDLVVCRYLLEHIDKPVQMLQFLGCLLNTNGRLLIEIPDSKKFLEYSDYSFIWEEHLSYFTDSTFRYLAEIAGYEIIKSMKFESLLEDALVYIIKPRIKKIQTKSNVAKSELAIFKKFQQNFSEIRRIYINILELLVSKGKTLAIFGAGHQAIMFINLFKIDGYLKYVIDDDTNKHDTFLPGTKLKIISSKDAFKDQAIDIILLGVSPKIEQKIVKKIAKFYNLKCEIYSIYTKSKLGTLISK